MGPYDSGATVQVAATASDGWRFDHWEGDLTGTTSSASITMNANKSVTAVFIQQFTLTTIVSPSGAGSVAPPETTSHDVGSTVSLVATENTGYRFHHWEGDCTGDTSPGTVTMDANKVVTAVFIQQYKLAVVNFGHGTTNPSGLTWHDAGAVVALSATANDGYRFSAWTNTNNNSINPTTITMTGHKSGPDTSVFVFFVQQFSLTTEASPPEGGSVSPADTTTYDSGTTVSVNPEANAGWRFHHWEGDLSGDTDPANITMDANKYAKAVFIQQFQLTTTASPAEAGSVEPPGETPHDSGSSVTVVAEPNDGWRFRHWEGDASGISPSASVTMDANKSVTAVFIRQFTLTTLVSPTDAGSVTPPGISVHDAGSSVTISPQANTGWRFDHWEGDLSGSDDPASVSMDANKTVTAVFVMTYTVTVTRYGLGSVHHGDKEYTDSPATIASDLGDTFTAEPGDPDDGEGPYTLLAWQVGVRNRIVQAASFTLEAEDAASDRSVSVDLVFKRLSVDYSSTFTIAAEGPTMPDVTMTMQIGPTSLPSWVEVPQYRFQIGKSCSGGYEILLYPDHAGGSMIRAERIDSGWTTSRTFQILPDSQSAGETKGWNQATIGVSGGYPTQVELNCQFRIVPTDTIVDENRTYDDPLYLGELLNVVGENPSEGQIDYFINSLTIPDLAGIVLPYVEPAGANRPFNNINDIPVNNSVPNVVTADDRLTEVKFIARRIFQHEAASRQFETSSEQLHASIVGYPLWQRRSGQAPNYQYDQGLGIAQLTVLDYQARSTMWNWKMNVLQAISIANYDFLCACLQLNEHPPVPTAAVVFPAVANLTVLQMRRLNSWSRYNGGPKDAYHWWNETASVPQLEASGLTVDGIEQSHSPSMFRLVLDSVHHGFGELAVRAAVCNFANQDKTTTFERAQESPFDFDLSVGGSRTASEFVHNEDQVWVRLAIYDVGNNSLAQGRIKDGSVADIGAGFMPPILANYTPGIDGMWCKMGYVESPGPNSNSARRDLNNDGVRDRPNDCYHVDGLGGPLDIDDDTVGNANELVAFAARYADIVAGP